MEENKKDTIDASPTQIHREVMRNEEVLGAIREPYGPGGMSKLCCDTWC